MIYSFVCDLAGALGRVAEAHAMASLVAESLSPGGNALDPGARLRLQKLQEITDTDWMGVGGHQPSFIMTAVFGALSFNSFLDEEAGLKCAKGFT